MTLVSFIIPCFNEAESLQNLLCKIQLLKAETKMAENEFELVFINDGSNDGTLDELYSLSKINTGFKWVVIDLSRNFGKEAALSCGLHNCTGQIAIPIDADLQDPLEVIPEMIELWKNGADVVNGVRSDRREDSWLKRSSAGMYYRVHNSISDVDIPPHVGDFRLLDRKVIDAICDLPENQIFMKGLVSWVGFRTSEVLYSRNKRVTGASKFTPSKLWSLAIQGLTSFSTAPLRIWTYIGLFGIMISLLYATYILFVLISFGNTPPGYPSLILTIIFFGSLQIMSIGVLGEYMGKSFLESKSRPKYIIRSKFEGE